MVSSSTSEDGVATSEDGVAAIAPGGQADQDIVDPIAVDLDVFGRARVPDGAASAESEDVAVALEAVCFALSRPVTVQELSSLLGCSATTVRTAIDTLAASLRGRGLMVQRHRDEMQLVTRPEVAWAVHRALNPERPSRLSRAALETLAIIAYRQPTTRAIVEAIRGVSCDAVVESLERRDLIREVGRQNTPGHPRLFGTTLRFLQIVGLERIEDLPSLPEGTMLPDLGAAGWGDLKAGTPEDGSDDSG